MNKSWSPLLCPPEVFDCVHHYHLVAGNVVVVCTRPLHQQVEALGSCIFFKPCHDTGSAPGGCIIVELLVRVRAPTVHRPLQGIEVAMGGRHPAHVFIPGAPIPPCPVQRLELAIGSGHQAHAMVVEER